MNPFITAQEFAQTHGGTGRELQYDWRTYMGRVLGLEHYELNRFLDPVTGQKLSIIDVNQIWRQMSIASGALEVPGGGDPFKFLVAYVPNFGGTNLAAELGIADRFASERQRIQAEATGRDQLVGVDSPTGGGLRLPKLPPLAVALGGLAALLFMRRR